jgi:hypothetical protein
LNDFIVHVCQHDVDALDAQQLSQLLDEFRKKAA